MPHARRLTEILPAALALLMLVSFLRFPDTVRESAAHAMSRCAASLVPALFPASAAASLLVRRMKRGTVLTVLLAGLAAGFPVGAVCAAALFRERRIGKRDAELLAALSSSASPAFLVGVLGGMWGDARYGWLLLAAQLPVLLGLFLLFRPGKRANPELPASAPSSFARDLTDAIGQAGAGCLTLTASVVFFSVAASVAEKLCPPLFPLVRLIFEFSAGAAFGASVGGIAGAALSGAAVGFGGLAVLVQIAAPMGEAGLSVKPYLLTRLVLASLLAAVSAAWTALYPMTPAVDALAPIPAVPPSVLAALLPALFVLSLLRRPKNAA